jgi:hypothetical protein
MTLQEFRAAVDAEPSLQIVDVRLGRRPDQDEVVVRNCHRAYACSVPAILRQDWDQIRMVLLGDREARVLTHVTRIVGYFSQIHNWNASKVAELHDRHRGEYTLPDGEASRQIRRG